MGGGRALRALKKKSSKHDDGLNNLWPQPWGEADRKDELELELQRLVCHGLLSVDEAQRAIAEDWPAAAEKYLK